MRATSRNRGGYHSMVSSDENPVGGKDAPPVHAVPDSLTGRLLSASRTHFLSVGSSDVLGAASKASLPPGAWRTRTVSFPPLVPRQCSMRERTGATMSATWSGWQPSVSVTVRRQRGAGRGGPSTIVDAGAGVAGAPVAAGCAPGARGSVAAAVTIGGELGGRGVHAPRTARAVTAREARTTGPSGVRILAPAAATRVPRIVRAAAQSRAHGLLSRKA
jgi:hypothetical protein